MTHDLVERLRAITLRFASESPDDAVKRRNETARLAADRIETYMADADAHVSRLDLVRRQEDEIRDLKAENAALRAERDSAFAMPKCECGADEACANLARLRAEKDELRKALEPFAKLAGRFMDETSQRLKPDDHNVWGYGDETLTYGDFRRAAAIHQMGERP